jgi:hypothetical protein
VQAERRHRRESRGAQVDGIIGSHAQKLGTTRTTSSVGRPDYRPPNSCVSAANVRRQSSRVPMTT